MTSYTNDWGLPKPDAADLIAGSSQNLRRDIGALADKTDQTLTQALGQALSQGRDEFVGSTEIRKIVTSRNPYATVSPGELHLVEATEKFFTMFHDTPIGEEPLGLTKEWNLTDYQVIEDNIALGGKLLRVVSTTATTHLLARPAPSNIDDPAISELVFKWRASNAASAPRATHRASGEPGSENGYYTVLRATGELTTGQHNNGAGGTQPTGSMIGFQPGRWYITRSRLLTTTRLIRSWPADEPEPTTWAIQRLDQTLFPTGGWTGLYVRGPGTADIDWIGIGYDTGAAPIPEV